VVEILEYGLSPWLHITLATCWTFAHHYKWQPSANSKSIYHLAQDEICLPEIKLEEII
jgi:hypothetical protein